MVTSNNGKASTREWSLGIFFIVLVSLLWAGGSILVQHIETNLGFNHPFVFTYIGSSVLATCIPAYLGCSLLGLTHNPPLRSDADRSSSNIPHYEELETVDKEHVFEEEDNSTQPLASGTNTTDNHGSPFSSGSSAKGGSPVATLAVAGMNSPSPTAPPPAMKSHCFMFKIGLTLSLIWFFAEWAYTFSLANTSVTNNTIIANSSTLFTYLFNVIAKTEHFTPLKTFGVALAFFGAVAVGMCDSGKDDANESLLGDAAALASAIAYGVYSTVLSLRAPSDNEVSMSLVLGYMGIVSVVVMMPLFVGLALAPQVRILDGITFRVVGFILMHAVLDILLSELLWARAVLLTTPTVATIGCSLTIPIAFASDFLIHGIVPNIIAVIGACMMIAGFYAVSGREGSAGVRGGSGGDGGDDVL